MFCTSCGTVIEGAKEPDGQTPKGDMTPATPVPDTDNVTPMPDTSVNTPPVAPMYNTPVATDTPYPYAATIPPESPAKKEMSKKTLTIIIASAAAAFIVIAVAVVFLIIHLNRTSAFEEATAYMDSGNYVAAHEIFENLGSFRDSEELAYENRLRIDYYAALQLMERGNYSEAETAFQALDSFRNSSELAIECRMIMDFNYAMQLMDNERFHDAKAAFEALGDFRDSIEMATTAQLEIDYAIALEYMESGDYQTAMELFNTLGTFRDSVDMAIECDNRIVYGHAVNLMNAGNYADAAVLFEPLAEINFRDSGELLLGCYYGLAEEAYEAGLFYTAHNLFASLGDFRDSRDRAEQCIQEHPATGQVYRNEDFPGSAVQLRIITPSGDPRPTFIKIYTADEVLVSTVFLRGESSHTVRLPVGTYMIRMGFGDNWFGTYEYFGDANAFYQTLFLDGDITYEFRRNFIYTLTLRTESEFFDLLGDFFNEGRDGF